MPAASALARLSSRSEPVWRRFGSAIVVVAVHLLLLLLLLRLAPPVVVRFGSGAPTVVTLIPDAAEAPQRTAKKAAKASGGARRKATPAARPRAERPASDEARDLSVWSQVIPMSRAELAASDIARFPQRAPEAAAGSGDSGRAEGEAAGDSEVVGTGPNGEPLYNAEWHRRPTHAELAGYRPADAPEGWGLVACRTIPDNRVEDCVELGQSPPGSGLARAVRLAAWQFRVRPPRKGGRPLLGAWVRIRIDYSIRGAR